MIWAAKLTVGSNGKRANRIMNAIGRDLRDSLGTSGLLSRHLHCHILQRNLLSMYIVHIVLPGNNKSLMRKTLYIATIYEIIMMHSQTTLSTDLD